MDTTNTTPMLIASEPEWLMDMFDDRYTHTVPINRCQDEGFNDSTFEYAE